MITLPSTREQIKVANTGLERPPHPEFNAKTRSDRSNLVKTRPPMVMVLAVIGAWSIHAQAPAQDFDKWWTPQNEALAAAPQHHTLLFENDEVRVLTVTIAPGVKEPGRRTVVADRSTACARERRRDAAPNRPRRTQERALA